MHHLRRNGFFALVAIALCACGSVAAQELSTTVPPSATSTATTSPTDGSGSTVPVCPTPGPGGAPTAFCETSAEESAGQTVVHSPTIPDLVLIGSNITLTIAPSDSPTISEQQAEVTAADHNGFNHNPRSAVFGEMHDENGSPTTGQLVWLVDVSPPSPMEIGGAQTIDYAYVIVDAQTGAVLAVDAEGAPNQ